MDSPMESFADINKFDEKFEEPSEDLKPAPKFKPSDLYYDMSGDKYLIIFNHYVFKKTKHFRNESPPSRKGTEADVHALKRVFLKMAYKVLVHNDLDYEEIIEVFKDISNQDHSTTSCLCIAFLTHGDTDDQLYAANRIYNLRDMTAKLEQGHPTLVGKPKLFFIQACRGKALDAGRRVQLDGSHSVMLLPSQADFLFFRSSIEGYTSFRNIKGSFLIQELCNAVSEHRETKDVHFITTMVNRHVAYYYSTYTPTEKKTDNKKQMPEVRHTLTKLFMF